MARPSSNTRSGESPSELQSPLLALPAELRNEIYSYVLGGKAIHLYVVEETKGDRIYGMNQPMGTHKRWSPAKKSKPHFLALLKTCRQIRAETHTLPFQLNDFYYEAFDIAFQIWAETENRVGAIRKVILSAHRLRGFLNQKAFELSMATLTGVREVEVMAGTSGQEEGRWDWVKRERVFTCLIRASPEDLAAIRDAFGRDVLVKYHD